MSVANAMRAEIADDVLAAAMLARLEVWRPTSTGLPNPWTAEAAYNMMSVAPLATRAMVAVGGRINSGYRSVAVNLAVKGSAKSRHLEGLAVDLSYNGAWGRGADGAVNAARKLYQLADVGELGRVHQIIAEPTWVHLGWRRWTEPEAAPQLLRYDGRTYSRLSPG